MLTDLELYLILRELKCLIIEHVNYDDKHVQISNYEDVLLLVNTLVDHFELEVLVKGGSMVGKTVLYNGEKFIILIKYESGFCEIRQAEGNKVELVKTSELIFI